MPTLVSLLGLLPWWEGEEGSGWIWDSLPRISRPEVAMVDESHGSSEALRLRLLWWRWCWQKKTFVKFKPPPVILKKEVWDNFTFIYKYFRTIMFSVLPQFQFPILCALQKCSEIKMFTFWWFGENSSLRWIDDSEERYCEENENSHFRNLCLERYNETFVLDLRHHSQGYGRKATILFPGETFHWLL